MESESRTPIPTQATQTATRAEQLFVITVPCTARMTVTASGESEARQILAALLGGGSWQSAALASAPVRFAVRVDHQGKAK